MRQPMVSAEALDTKCGATAATRARPAHTSTNLPALAGRERRNRISFKVEPPSSFCPSGPSLSGLPKPASPICSSDGRTSSYKAVASVAEGLHWLRSSCGNCEAARVIPKGAVANPFTPRVLCILPRWDAPRIHHGGLLSTAGRRATQSKGDSS